jgi:hypothetical protein
LDSEYFSISTAPFTVAIGDAFEMRFEDGTRISSDPVYAGDRFLRYMKLWVTFMVS